MQNISMDVLRKASKGDLVSFEIIYKASSSFVYNIAYRIVNNKEEAEEVTQEVFLVIYRKLQCFRFQATFKTWVYRVAVNCALNHVRKMTQEKKRMVEYDEELVSAKVAAKDNPETGQECQEEAVHSLLQALNPDQKACIILRSLEGLSYQQIAETLKININTVRSRIKRARETLLAFRQGGD
jgi:RNA polymerase sigma-70 factor, ECF subfamily